MKTNDIFSSVVGKNMVQHSNATKYTLLSCNSLQKKTKQGWYCHKGFKEDNPMLNTLIQSIIGN